MLDLMQSFLINEVFGDVILFSIFIILLVFVVFDSIGIGVQGVSAFVLIISYTMMREGYMPQWVFYAELFLGALIWYMFLRDSQSK